MHQNCMKLLQSRITPSLINKAKIFLANNYEKSEEIQDFDINLQDHCDQIRVIFGEVNGKFGVDQTYDRFSMFNLNRTLSDFWNTHNMEVLTMSQLFVETFPNTTLLEF